jgi:hypothetical protein
MCATKVGAYVGCSGLNRDKWVAADSCECMRAIMVGYDRGMSVIQRLIRAEWHGGNVGACGGLRA